LKAINPGIADGVQGLWWRTPDCVVARCNSAVARGVQRADGHAPLTSICVSRWPCRVETAAFTRLFGRARDACSGEAVRFPPRSPAPCGWLGPPVEGDNRGSEGDALVSCAVGPSWSSGGGARLVGERRWWRLAAAHLVVVLAERGANHRGHP